MKTINGKDWIRILDGWVGFLAIAPSDSQTIICNGLIKTSDGGTTWIELDLGVTDKFNSETVAIHPRKSNLVLFGTQGAGIFRSVNGGKTWNPSSLDFHGAQFT